MSLINCLNCKFCSLKLRIKYKLINYIVWGQRVYDPSPFHVKAQGLRRGDTGPRTHHKSQGRSKEMAEDELLLGMP